MEILHIPDIGDSYHKNCYVNNYIKRKQERCECDMFTVLNEEKLTTDERNDLPNTLFGLPKERKYPLNDEEHVKKAIQFFKFCPKLKRNELAKNINRRMRELDMQIKVGKNNPFSAYNHVSESSSTLYMDSDDMTTDDNEIVNRMTPPKDYPIYRVITYLKMNRIFQVPDIVTQEQYIFDNIDFKSFIAQYVHDCTNMDECSNPIREMNIVMLHKYDSVLSYLDYEGHRNMRLLYFIVDDLIASIMDPAIITEPKYELKVLRNLLEHRKINPAYIKRKLWETHLEWMYRLQKHAVSNPDLIYKIDEQICRMANDTSLIDLDILNSDMTVSDVNKLAVEISKHGVALYCATEYIEKMKSKKETDLYIIKSASDKSLNSVENKPVSQFIVRGMLSGESFYSNVIYRFDGYINPDKLDRGKFKKMNFQLDGVDLVRSSKLPKYVKQIYVGIDRVGNNIYFGISDETVYLLAKDKTSKLPIIYLIDISQINADYFYRENDDPRASNLRIIKLSFIRSNKVENKPTTESLSIDADGNVRLVIDSKKSYMDQYMENHRVLVENWKNKNYDGVKQNLAYAFALINIVERNKKFKERNSEIVKARAFLINDFKTYLKLVQEVDPTFDFSVYYKGCEYDKLLFSLPVESITGIKKIVAALLK